MSERIEREVDQTPIADDDLGFRGLAVAHGRGEFVVDEVIAGPADCTTEFGNAANAIRLKQFVNATGATAAGGDICQGTLAPALPQALDTCQAACENFPPIGRQRPD